MKQRGPFWRTTAGTTLLILGLIGLLMPIMPGWPLIIPGLILIGTESRFGRWIHRWTPGVVKRLIEKAKEITGQSEK
jgi:uncharacterized protein YqgC (DUF456 family)